MKGTVSKACPAGGPPSSRRKQAEKGLRRLSLCPPSGTAGRGLDVTRALGLGLGDIPEREGAGTRRKEL